jgi:hypothetical protein
VYVPAATEDRTQYGFVPEHGLHPHGGPGHPVTDQRLPPQGELLPGGADDLIRHQTQRDDATWLVLFAVVGRGLRRVIVRWGRRAAVELPANPVGDRGRGQQPVVPPPPAALPSVRPGGDDLHPDAGQPADGQAVVQPPGQRLGREHQRLGARFRRVELLDHGQVRGRRAGRERPGVQAAGQPVRALPRVAEPAGHVADGQRGEIAERAQAQPVQQCCQILGSRALGSWILGGQDAHRLGAQEPRRPARRHGPAVPAVPGGEKRGEEPVRDTDLAVLAEVRQRGGDPGGQRRLAAEVAGRTAGAERAHP